MSPEAPKAPDQTAAAPQPAVTPSDPSGAPKPVTPLSTMPESQFQTLKQPRDIWGMVWKGLIGLNFFIAFLFGLFVVLRVVGLSSNEFQAGALGTPFWLIPTLLIGELLVAAVYGFLKRPKLSEVTSILMWLGIGLGVAFVCAIGFVVYASVS